MSSFHTQRRYYCGNHHGLHLLQATSTYDKAPALMIRFSLTQHHSHIPAGHEPCHVLSSASKCLRAASLQGKAWHVRIGTTRHVRTVACASSNAGDCQHQTVSWIVLWLLHVMNVQQFILTFSCHKVSSLRSAVPCRPIISITCCWQRTAVVCAASPAAIASAAICNNRGS
jgi:hypothetical protein